MLHHHKQPGSLSLQKVVNKCKFLPIGDKKLHGFFSFLLQSGSLSPCPVSVGGGHSRSCDPLGFQPQTLGGVSVVQRGVMGKLAVNSTTVLDPQRSEVTADPVQSTGLSDLWYNCNLRPAQRDAPCAIAAAASSSERALFSVTETIAEMAKRDRRWLLCKIQRGGWPLRPRTLQPSAKNRKWERRDLAAAP